jgi:hypothetical protein
MLRTQVSSSNLASVGYDPATLILEIEFLSGRIYHYYGVPETVYQGLMEAESHGKYFNQFVKNGGYSYERVH